MLTVPEAARLAGRDPETVRRWIRKGRLQAQKIGTQHFIEEDALNSVLDEEYPQLPVPEAWRETEETGPIPNVVRWIHLSRQGH